MRVELEPGAGAKAERMLHTHSKARTLFQTSASQVTGHEPRVLLAWRHAASKYTPHASSRGSHWADEDYVGEASPHRITSPRGEADDSKNVEMGNMGHAAYSMANANDGRMRLPPLGAQPDGRPRLPPLAASEKGGDVPSASVDDVLRDAEPSDPGAGPSFRRHDLSVDTSSTSGAAGGASAADPSPAHIAPATKGWGTPKNQAGLGQQEGGGRASRGRRGLSFGGIISGSSGS